MSGRLRALGMVLGLATFAGAPSAYAGPPTVCISLAHQLDLADRDATGFTDPGLNAAIYNLRQQLDLATVQARRQGCLGGAFFRQGPDPSCAALMPAIAGMEAQLRQLDQQRRMGPPAVRADRARILADLSANGCDGIYDAYPRPRGLFASLLDDGTFDGSGPDTYDPSGRENSYVAIEGYGETFRTLCVRTCDGYYFPISFATDPSRFQDDAQACSAACPGAPAALYVHRSAGEGVEQMVSLTGEPYTSLPAAFAYRKTYNASCTCRAAGAAAGFTPVPTAPKAAPAADKPEAAQVEARKNVRIVGPDYYVAR